jgi:hypothetical protein
MSTVTRAAAYTVQVAVATAQVPVLATVAATAETTKLTANLVSWEIRQLASSPLSAGARRLEAEYRELTAARDNGSKTPGRPQRHAGGGRERHSTGSAPSRPGEASTQSAA